MSELTKSNKPKLQISEQSGQFLISFVAENKVKEWVQEFVMSIEKYRPKFAKVLNGQVGTHVDENVRTSGSWTDLLVVFTNRYAYEPPEELNIKINEMRAVANCENRLWVAIYDPCEFLETEFSKAFDQWHILKGRGDNDTFLEPSEVSKGWKSDIETAVRNILDHPSCSLKSRICPKYQSASTAAAGSKQQNTKSFFTRVFSRLRRSD